MRKVWHNYVMVQSMFSVHKLHEYVLYTVYHCLTHSVDEQTTKKVLSAHTAYISLCGHLHMTFPRDAFLMALCKACLPPKYLLSLMTQQSKFSEGKNVVSKTERISSKTSSPESRLPSSDFDVEAVGSQGSSQDLPRSTNFGARRNLDLSESSSVASEGMRSETGGVGCTPTTSVTGLGGGVKEQQQPGLVKIVYNILNAKD